MFKVLLKDLRFYSSFFIFDKTIYIKVYCRKFNAELNKLIENRRSPCSLFVEHTHLCQQVWLYLDIFIFSLSSCNTTLTLLGLLVVCINRMSMHKKVHTKCAKPVDEKNYWIFCCLKCSLFWAKNIDQRSYKFWKKLLCHHTTFFSLFNMSSYRNPEIRNIFP